MGPRVGLAATAKSNALHLREANRRSGEPNHITTDVLSRTMEMAEVVSWLCGAKSQNLLYTEREQLLSLVKGLDLCAEKRNIALP